MTDPLEDLMGEVWEWKRKAAEETKGMSSAELVEFYKRKGDEFERECGIKLRTRPASQEAASRPRE
jgi:hypothetical protein